MVRQGRQKTRSQLPRGTDKTEPVPSPDGQDPWYRNLLLRRAAEAALVLVLIGIYLCLDHFSWPDLKNYLPHSSVVAALSVLLLYLVKTILMAIPLNGLFLMASFLLPPVWAILVTLGGLILELTIGYRLGRHLDEASIIGRLERYRLSSWLLQLIRNKTTLCCFLFRFLPPPAELTNMLAGAVALPFASYLLSSLAGLLPKAIAVILTGEALFGDQTGKFLALFALILVLEFLPLLLIRYVNQTRRRKL